MLFISLTWELTLDLIRFYYVEDSVNVATNVEIFFRIDDFTLSLPN